MMKKRHVIPQNVWTVYYVYSNSKEHFQIKQLELKSSKLVIPSGLTINIHATANISMSVNLAKWIVILPSKRDFRLKPNIKYFMIQRYRAFKIQIMKKIIKWDIAFKNKCFKQLCAYE